MPRSQSFPRIRVSGHAGAVHGTSKSSSRQEAHRENPDDDLAQPESPPDHRAQSPEPPPEGEWETRRPPGVRAGPYPDIDIIVTATLDQLAHARHAAARAPGQPTLDG